MGCLCLTAERQNGAKTVNFDENNAKGQHSLNGAPCKTTVEMVRVCVGPLMTGNGTDPNIPLRDWKKSMMTFV